jgi:hypothetical protein
MLLYDILKFLNLTATETTSDTLQLAPNAFSLITHRFQPKQPPELINRSFYEELFDHRKPSPQSLLRAYSYINIGIIERPIIELSCTLHAPHLPPNSLIIDMVRLGTLKSFRLTIPGNVLIAKQADPIFEANIYAILNKEFGGNLHEKLLVKPKGL